MMGVDSVPYNSRARTSDLLLPGGGIQDANAASHLSFELPG